MAGLFGSNGRAKRQLLNRFGRPAVPSATFTRIGWFIQLIRASFLL
jgi:hypothetical protein